MMLPKPEIGPTEVLEDGGVGGGGGGVTLVGGVGLDPPLPPQDTSAVTHADNKRVWMGFMVYSRLN